MEKVKEFIAKAWLWLKQAWVTIKKVALKVWAFLKKWGLQLINLLVIIVAYDIVSDSLVVGLWLFCLLGYYIFWKLLGAESLFKKDEDE